jgi:hypothetical protein
MRIKVWSVFALLLLLCAPRFASAQLKATPDLLDFGDVILTEIKDDQLVLENTGPTDVLVTNLSLTTPGNGRPTEFEILTPAVKTFLLTGNGGKRTITFRFAPDFEGLRTITFLVETDQGNFPVVLQGNGILTHPELIISQLNINFGKVSISGKKDAVVDVTNIGDDDAKISDVNIANFSGTEHFKAFPEDITKPFPVILAKGESMKLHITFEGAAPLGSKAGTITLVGSVGGQTVIDLLGEVVGADIVVSPDPIDFGDVGIGVPVTKIVTVTAISEEPIDIDYIGDLFAPFSFVTPPTVPLKLQPGVPVQFEIQLIADAPGPISSQIQFISEDFTGSNFKGFDIRANGRTPVRVASSQDFTFYCGSKKKILRTAILENKSVNPITVQGFVAPMGVAVLTGTPLQVGATSTTAITYEFDPVASGIERDLVIEYLDAASVLVRDTVHVTPVTARVDLEQSVQTNGLEVQGVSVTSSFDLTDFEVRDLDFAIHFEKPDLFSLIKDSVRLNPALLPNATYDLRDLGAGAYVLEIRSADPITFNATASLSSQPFFTYHPRAFAAIESESEVDINLINADLCADLSGDTTTLVTSAFCGDEFIREALRNADASTVKLYPNPTLGSQLKLEFASSQAEPMIVVVRDMKGNEVKRITYDIAAGSNTFTIPTADLGDGVHFISMRTASRSHEVKFVVQH